MGQHENNQTTRKNPVFAGIKAVCKGVGKLLSFCFKSIFILCVLALIAAAIVGSVWVYPKYKEYHAYAQDIVNKSAAETFQKGEASYIYDKDGNLLARLCGDEDSEYLSYEELPAYVVDAFVAVEDRSFWENPGYDLKGILRVGINFIRTKGEEKHGASTITQQLARGEFLTREVSLTRKAKEILVAMELTKKYSKEQIAEFYINTVSFANTYYGIQSAAKAYFSKPVSELTLSQIAYLCAIPNSPTYYNPYTHPENALKRRDKILGDMLECGFIGEEEYQAATQEEIVIEKPEYPFYNYETSYAIECAVRELMMLDGFEFQYGLSDAAMLDAYNESYYEAYDKAKEKLYQGGYTIYTSLDAEKQRILQTAVNESLQFDAETTGDGIFALQGSATLIDNKTGKVEAVVGGRTQETNIPTFNRAYQGFRQPGSTAKPLLVYGPALEAGFTPNSIVENINVGEAKKQGADILSMTGSASTMRQALERSRNGCAYWLYARITPQKAMEYLTKMRFHKLDPADYGMSACLGGFTNGTTTEEMAAAYRMIENHGSYTAPTCIIKMVDRNGNEVYKPQTEEQIFDERTADTLLDMMKGVITRGTASSMRWDNRIEAAGKTGTTNNSKDGWFCGMTPYYTLAVWVGYDQPRELSSLYGATYPATIWKRAMKEAVNGLDPKRFERAEVSEEDVEAPTASAEQYLPGRADSEVLSSGYTVKNYREDHALADRARELLAAGDTAGASALVEQIYGQTLKRQMRAEVAAR